MKNSQGKLPLLLSGIGVAIMVALAARGFAVLPIALASTRAALVTVYIAWLVVESRVARSEVKRPSTRLDKGTLELYAAARAATVILALLLSGVQPLSTIAVGASIFVSGIALRLIAIRTLGRFYSHRIRVSSDQTVVDTGPYRLMRHPAYTGMLLAHAGFVLASFHVAAAAALVALFVPAVVARILIEERALTSTMPAYADYCRGRARLLPFLW
jgi:protein-S-isoprenylcysteine O-methyltransferase Ste14